MNLSQGYGPRLLTAVTFSLVGFLIRLTYFMPPMTMAMNLTLVVVTLVLVFLIWGLFSWLNRQLDPIVPFETHAPARVALQLGLGVMFLFVLRYGLGFWAVRYLPFKPSPLISGLVTGVDILLALSLNLGVISHYMVNRWKDSITKATKLEKETAELRYSLLKDQVNPHFLFNAFSSLQALIQIDPEAASRYVQDLAEVYRYHLERDKQAMVALDLEWKMFKRYVRLLETRYESGIKITLPEDDQLPKGEIPTLSLRMLIDNALKHNEVHPEIPLIINIDVEGNYLKISNNLQPRRQLDTSHQQGLRQLASLLALHHQALKYGIAESKKQWEVWLPVCNSISK